MSLLGVLTIVFVVLKLVGVVTWSWLVVLSPAIIGFSLWLVVMTIYVRTLGLMNKKVNKDMKEFKNYHNKYWKGKRK